MEEDHISCPDCADPVSASQVFCPCGGFVGYPNVRRAEAMRSELMGHYNQALAGADGTGLQAEASRLEHLLAHSVPTLAVSARVLRNIAFGGPYLNYYKAVDRGARSETLAKYLRDRGKVDVQIHTGYHVEILNAALSPDGRGVISYGPIVLVLDSAGLEERISVLRDNAYSFYSDFRLGELGASEPPGWRSVWSDKHFLGFAKLAGELRPGITDEEICSLILSSEGNRAKERFLELHLYGDLNRISIKSARLQAPLADDTEVKAWTRAKARLDELSIPHNEGTL